MSRPNVATPVLTRAKLAEVLGQRPEQIRAFEAMFSDVNSVIPDAVEAAADSAAAAEAAAAAAAADAAAALAVSSGLDARVDVLEAQEPGHTIEDEGTPLTQRGVLNFVGSGVSVADSGGKTVVTISGGGGGGGGNSYFPAGW